MKPTPQVRRWLRLAAGLAALLLVSIAGAAPAAGAGAGAGAQAAVLYHNYCSVCHGDKGDGKSRASGSLSTVPRDFSSEASKRELTRERIVAVVTHGSAGTAMVGWKTQLSQTDIARLADYVLTQFVHADAQAAGRAKRLYDGNCAVCHGDRGAGAVWARDSMARPPRDFTAPAAQALTRESMVAVATHGRPGTAMAGFGGRLSGEEIGTVVDYIRSSLMSGAAISGSKAHGGREADTSTPAQVDMTAGLPTGLRGDLKRGGAFYLANCATCHGARGDGAGPRAYFINPKPRNFIEDSARARFNRVALFAAVSEGRLGSEMPAWKQVATPQQMADVSEYVFQTFIQGKPSATATAAR